LEHHCFSSFDTPVELRDTATMSIEILASEVVDQIAAGEVVERPAHLVKELLENSLDAGSTDISVEFSEGGREVTVVDNGQGISAEDLSKALARHATSKIRQSDDLWKLSTFGFRGEALASIAAVSKLSLSSKSISSESGARIISEFGRINSSEGVGHTQGTRIQISDLFGNMPARLKFLKSASAETSQIKTVIKAMALSHPQVSFRVTQDRELISLWPKVATKLERAQQIFEMQELFEGSAERDGVKASAIFASPSNTVKSSRQIWMFAQNRWIQDRSLQAAVMEAYRNLLMHGEYPIAAVWVETDPAEIDVNIHPSKSQVKFANSSLAFRAVQASVRDTLEKAPWIPKSLSENVGQAIQSYSQQQPQPVIEPLKFADQEFSRIQFKQKSHFVEPASVAPMPQKTGHWSSMQVLGQADLTYLIGQTDKAVVFVDQHAAHERVMFEKLMSAWRGQPVDVQDFLFPLAMDLSMDKMEVLLRCSADLQKLGIEIESLGPATLGIRSAPAALKESALVTALEKMSQEILDHGGSYQIEKTIADLCASMACHSAIRAGQAQTTEEMQALLQQMDEFPLSSFCPHGRPVSVEYPFSKLERDFGRIV